MNKALNMSRRKNIKMLTDTELAANIKVHKREADNLLDQARRHILLMNTAQDEQVRREHERGVA